MASKPDPDEDDRIETGVTHDGAEVAVRARSQHSHAAHVPATDDDDAVVFADGCPKAKCGVEPNSDTDFVLRPIRDVIFRDKCKRCFDADGVKQQNKANGGSKTWVRKLMYDDWGSEESSNGAEESTDN